MRANQGIQVKVLYFAALQEAAGRSFETVDLAPEMSGRALYEQLARRYQFQLSAADLRLAINQQFADFDRPLQAGDEVAFIPPVAGG